MDSTFEANLQVEDLKNLFTMSANINMAYASPPPGPSQPIQFMEFNTYQPAAGGQSSFAAYPPPTSNAAYGGFTGGASFAPPPFSPGAGAARFEDEPPLLEGVCMLVTPIMTV